MPRVDADRNLIFGILALQMDFISRDALIGALNAWVLEKSRPLGHILVERGVLTDDEHALLDALVLKHLEKHRGDPEASLSALGPAHGASEGLLEQVDDPDLRAGLSRLGTADSADDPDRTRTYAGSVNDAGDGAARFRILRSHAEGGLGRVFVALDRELNREVALKQIKDERVGASSSRARFVFEAEVTGGLEHPGIVPVYAMGRYDDGRPYYAMRLIKGETLKEAIRRYHETGGGEDGVAASGRGSVGRSMALRRLIGRLIAVCNAVAYAHSRGVLHRDIKPSNIMLGKYGETLVVDWGLAKAVDRPDVPAFADEQALRPSSGSDEQRTMPGSAVGTPEYMSPEQAAGGGDGVGAASDIYNLGATLYCLLTGRPPFDHRIQGSELPAMVQAGDFPPPRRVKPDIPPALDAICRKAMARRPEDRYASALELASDLEHWLADEPVTAYREPASARAGRWVRRHRPTVAASSALLGAAVVGLAINNELVRGQRDLARRAETAALSARAEAESSRQKESAARQEAEDSLKLAREAVDRMLVKVADSALPSVPRLVPLRKGVALDAMRFAREFLKRRPSDRDVQSEAAMIFRRVANIERMTGDFAAALPHYAEAEALHQRLIVDSPDPPKDRNLLAELERDFAEALKMASRPADALVHYDIALAIARDVLAAGPDDPGARRTLASIQNDSGLALFEAGRTPEGLARCDEAVAIFSDLGRRQPPPGPVDPLLHLVALVDRAPMQREAGRHSEAEAALSQAVTLARAMVAKKQYGADARYYLAMALCAQGTIWTEDRARPDEAEAAFDEAVRRLTDLRKEAPSVRFYRPALAEAQSGRGAARLLRGRLAEADADVLAAQQALEALAAEQPRDAQAAGLLAATLARRARLALRRGDRAAAAALWERAIARQESLVRDDPDNPRARRALERLRADREADAGGP